MAIMTSKTYAFRSSIVPQMLNPPHYAVFSDADKRNLADLVTRLDASRERSRFVPVDPQPFSGPGFKIHVTAVMAEVQKSPEESLKIVERFHEILSRNNVPPAWYESLGTVIDELGLDVSKDLTQAIEYAQGFQGSIDSADRGYGQVFCRTMNWNALRSRGETEYVPF
jgi:hypothetical protein